MGGVERQKQRSDVSFVVYGKGEVKVKGVILVVNKCFL